MAFAEETPPFNLTTLNGKKYTGVTVTRVEGDAIAINHDDGTARVFFADLPPELRTKYGYDPNKAAAAAAQRAEAMARQREIDAKNMEAEKQLKAAPFAGAAKEVEAKKTSGDNSAVATPSNAVKVLAAEPLRLNTAEVKNSKFSLVNKPICLGGWVARAQEVSPTQTKIEFGNSLVTTVPTTDVPRIKNTGALRALYIYVASVDGPDINIVLLGNHVGYDINRKPTYSWQRTADKW